MSVKRIALTAAAMALVLFVSVSSSQAAPTGLTTVGSGKFRNVFTGVTTQIAMIASLGQSANSNQAAGVLLVGTQPYTMLCLDGVQTPQGHRLYGEANRGGLTIHVALVDNTIGKDFGFIAGPLLPDPNFTCQDGIYQLANGGYDPFLRPVKSSTFVTAP